MEPILSVVENHYIWKYQTGGKRFWNVELPLSWLPKCCMCVCIVDSITQVYTVWLFNKSWTGVNIIIIEMNPSQQGIFAITQVCWTHAQVGWLAPTVPVTCRITSAMLSILCEREPPHWLWPRSHMPCCVLYDSSPDHT